MFTLYDLSQIVTELPAGIKYMIYQLEKCPETGTLHYQGYLELEKPTRMNAVKRLFGSNSMHLEKRMGTQQEAIDYCRKDETRVEDTVILGMPGVQGNRSDVENAVSILKQGGKMINIVEENPALFIRGHKGLKAMEQLLIKQRLGKIIENFEVIVYYGPTGTGKTWKAYHHRQDVFKVPTYDMKTLWFDGYDGESCILLDEFHGQLDFNLLKQLLDRYVSQWPVKGSFIYSQWNTVLLTSNKHPMEWYSQQSIDEWKQLERRITTLTEMKDVWDEDAGRSGQVILAAHPPDESDAKVLLFEDSDVEEIPPIIEYAPIPGNQLEVDRKSVV